MAALHFDPLPSARPCDDALRRSHVEGLDDHDIVTERTGLLIERIPTALLAVLALVAVSALLLMPQPTSDQRAVASGSVVSRSAAGRATHVVGPGDSYWSVATQLDPEGDVRATVDRLVASNDGRALEVGDHIEFLDSGISKR